LLQTRLPFDDEANGVPLVQDALQLGHAVRARPLEGDLVRDAEDLHRPRVARDLPVWHRNHVVQTQGLRWERDRQTDKERPTEIERPTDRQTDRERETETNRDRQQDIQTGIESDRQR